MQIIWPQYRIQDLFGEPEKTIWGEGPIDNRVFIKTTKGEWFEGTAGNGGLDKNKHTWNVEVWQHRSEEFVRNAIRDQNDVID